MIIKNVVSKVQMALSTRFDSQILIPGVPMLVKFADERELENLLATGTFKLSTAPPPAEINVSKVATPPAENHEKPTQSKVDDKEEKSDEDKGDIPSTIQRESESTTQQTPETTSGKCPKCGAQMVLVTDTSRPNAEILCCPLCATEVVNGDASSETPAENAPKKTRVYSKCPICGRRKAADAEYCKKCIGKEGSQQPETN